MRVRAHARTCGVSDFWRYIGNISTFSPYFSLRNQGKTVKDMYRFLILGVPNWQHASPPLCSPFVL